MIETVAKVATDLFRNFLFLLDQVVYGLIPTLYKLIISLANVDLYNDNVVLNALINRVYILVGVFMLFRLAFSILRYIIDPNSFSDKSKGFTGLVRRVLVVLILLVSIPWVFGKLYEYQGIILDKQIIPNLILGTQSSSVNDLDEAAVDLQFIMFGPFFSVNYESTDLSSCKPDKDYPLANIIGSTNMALKDNCLEEFAKAIDNDEGVKTSGTVLSDLFKTDDPDEKMDFKKLGGLVTWSTSDGSYGINYLPFISTICGGYLVFLLLSFCIDIAMRLIKMLFLQILSPIAIITTIDPTSSTQNDKLKDWGMECLRTYLSLFLRLVVIYVVIQLVSVITSRLFTSNLYYEQFVEKSDSSLNIFIYIFLILGAFSVAKKIPELIEKAFGVKMSGELSLNPFKTLGSNSLITGALGLGTGAIAGGLAGAVAGVEAGAPVRGVLGGIGTGAMKGMGTKPGFGMFHDLRRKTYKDMTGSDLRSYNPLSKIYGVGGEKKVGEVKSIINQGREQLNLRHTKLNSVSSMNSKRYRNLIESGIDPSKVTRSQEEIKNNRDALKKNIDMQRNVISRNKSALSTLQQKKDSFNRIDEINKEIEHLNRQINNPHMQSAPLLEQIDKLSAERDEERKTIGSVSLDDVEKNISRVEDEMKTRTDNLSQLQREYNNEDLLYKYFDGIKEEDALRAEIGSIEKDISTLSDQSSQMQQFYHIDSSPKQSVEEAKKHIADRESKL